MPESFNEILNSVSHLLLGNGMQNGQKSLKGDSAFGLAGLHQALDLGFGRVLTQGSDHLTDLINLETESLDYKYLPFVLFFLQKLCFLSFKITEYYLRLGS